MKSKGKTVNNRLQKKVEKLHEQADEILSLPGFKDDTLALRKKWKIPAGGIKGQKKVVEWRSNLNNEERNSFDHDVRDLVVKYGLAPRWHQAVVNYALIKQLVGGWVAPVVSHKLDKDDNIVDFHIKIEKDTAMKDIEMVWPWVEMIQKDMRGRFDKNYRPQKPENKKRDRDILKLREEGESLEHIYSKTGVAYPDVAAIVSRTKKRHNKA